MELKIWFTGTGLSYEENGTVYSFNFESENYKHVISILMHEASKHNINVLQLLADAPTRVRSLPVQNDDDDSVQIIEDLDDSVQIIDPDIDSMCADFEGLQYGSGRKRKGTPEPSVRKSRRVDDAQDEAPVDEDTLDPPMADEEDIPDAQRLPIDEDSPNATSNQLQEPNIEIFKIPYGLTDDLTDEAVDKANKHLEIYGSAKFKRINMDRMSLPILRLRFVDIMDGDKPAYEIIGETLNTFLISMVAKAGGNMKTTELAVGLYHPGLKENNGLWHRRTGEMIDGYVLQNQLAKIIQSNDEVRIDDALEFELHVFKNIDISGGCVKNCETDGNKYWFDKKAGARAFIRSDGKRLLKYIILGRIHYDAHTATPGTIEKAISVSKWRGILAYQKNKMNEHVKELEAEFKLPDKNIHSLNDLKYMADFDTSRKYHIYVRDHVDPKFRLITTFNDQATKLIRIDYRDEQFDLIRLDSSVVDTMFYTKCLQCRQNGFSDFSEMCHVL